MTGRVDEGRGSRRFAFHNDRETALSFWLEPWAEGFEIAPGSRLEIVLEGGEADDAPFALTDHHLVFYAPGGSTARILIDGKQLRSASAEIPVPSAAAAAAGTRTFIGTLFGAPPADALGAAMGDGDVRLEPLAEAHRAALKAACAEDEAIWPIYAISYDPDHFDASFEALLARPNTCGFAVFSGGVLAGMSCYLGIEPARGVLEIGNTYYVPALRGTGLNRTVKALMIGRAISCGYRRVEFRVDARNARSQAAMAKLGAVREGVIRAERVTWTGHVRDTILFSILANEWAKAST